MRFYNFFRRKKSKLEHRVTELESILFDLIKELGYVVTIESTTESEWSYPELKKIKNDEDKD